jgi:hypothetical protein
MSSGSTLNYLLPYPVPTDPVNVAGDIKQLADQLDTNLTEWIEDRSSSMWTSGGEFTNGLQAPTYNDSTGKMSMSLSQDIRSSSSPNFVGLTLSGDAAVNGGDITTTATTFNLVNATATTINVGQAATTINIGSSSGQVDFRGNVNVATGKQYEINNVSVLTSTTLGSSVVNSSLTSLGTVSTGTWNATTIAVNKGGTGLTSYTVGDIVYASGSTTLAKLAGIATGNALVSGGVGTAPSWGKIGLATHVSGTLPVSSGGTGVTASTGTGSVVLSTSPTFTGTPLSTTASVNTNTTQIATTAFVIGQAGSSNPLVNNSVSVGSSLRYSREDHVHPIDSTRAPISSPVFTGTVSSNGTSFIMNADASSGENVYFIVERGSDPDVQIRWNDVGDAWQFTNDGTTYYDIPTAAGGGAGMESILMFAGL